MLLINLIILIIIILILNHLKIVLFIHRILEKNFHLSNLCILLQNKHIYEKICNMYVYVCIYMYE